METSSPRLLQFIQATRDLLIVGPVRHHSGPARVNIPRAAPVTRFRDRFTLDTVPGIIERTGKRVRM